MLWRDISKVVVIRDYGSFFSNNTYNPGLPTTPHNPTLTWMPTSSSTVSLRVPIFWPVSVY